MSRTWQRRVGAARRHGHRAVTSAVTLCAVLGAAAAIKVFLVTSHPTEGDVTAITIRIDNQRAAAGQFGADCVGMFLTTPATKVAALQPCLTVPKSQTVPQASRAAATPPWVINTPKDVVRVQRPSINKVLKDFERDRLITVRYAAVDVLDPARLTRLAT
jgi:hypothetical protein